MLPLTLGCLGLVKMLHKSDKSVPATAAKPPNTKSTTGRERSRRPLLQLAIGSADTIAISCAIITCLLTACLFHNTRTKAMMSVNYYASMGMWNKAIETARPFQHSKFACHTINLALYNTGRLGDDMLKYNQVKGALTLLDESTNSLGQWWSFDAYIYLGHMNIAESMLISAMENFGERPIILKRLALVNMVKGNTGAAKVYLGALSRTLFDAGWAKDYLDKIERDPDLSTDKEIQRLRSMMPEKDRDFESLDDNLFLDLLDKNRNNRMAFEYLAASYLLTGNLDKFAGIAGRFDDFDYKAIPRSYEEAILLYNYLKNKKIALHGLEISREATERFKNFNDILLGCYKANKKLAYDELAKNFGDSYFFYYLYGTSVIKK